MAGTWSKLKKSLWFRNSTLPVSSQNWQRLPNRSDSGSTAPRSTSSTNSSVASLSSRFSRSLSTNACSSKKTCAICLGNLKTGEGQAIFTAECSHSFHFTCIANCVNHGNLSCPICRFKWKELPFQLHNTNLDAGQARVSPDNSSPDDYIFDVYHALRPGYREPVRFSDDESLADSTGPTPHPPSNKVSVKSFTLYPAVAARESLPDFAVLVDVRAPPLLEKNRQSERVPIDLVLVLDVSGSMSGSKITLLKRAAGFVIDNLGFFDRLSVVSFSERAKRIFPLRRMTDRGREDAKVAICSLVSNGGTDILSGLKKGVRVLEERGERNPVASIILLSDGKDTFNFDYAHQSDAPLNHNRFTEFLNNHKDQRSTFPVHTFGFGGDHDSSIMHAISDASDGTFSFIESVGMVQDAFARCIGGLLSVVAQEFRLTVKSASPGIQIGSILSGSYKSEISEQGLEGVINIGDLYADEEKEFLVYLSIPVCSQAEKTTLLNITYSYKDVSKATIKLDGERVEINRPMILSPTDHIVSIEVDRQRNRLLVAESIAEAQRMAETGNFEGAQAVLTERRSALLSSASALAGDSLCSWLEAELREIRSRMVNMEIYEQAGRAYALSGLSSHSWQRAATRGDSVVLNNTNGSSSGTSMGFSTPSMVTMVSKSQILNSVNPS